jgi:hypothetical protein
LTNREISVGTQWAQVKFAPEPKEKAFLLDEAGKEFKASLVKKAATQPALSWHPIVIDAVCRH